MPLYRAGRDLVRLEAAEPAVRGPAASLWAEVPDTDARADELRLRVEVSGAAVEGDPEEALVWEVSNDETRLVAPGIEMTIRPRERRASATVARSLVGLRPGLVARLLLEAPVTAMKMVTMQLLHAGAVVGPAGAAVVRGAAGAGKSTLVAACRAAGLGFLGDESLLVDRDDADRHEATLRDLVLTPESARLLGLDAASVPAFSGGERKRRVPLPEPLAPADRLARRVATVLLGPREPGPARLVPISGAAFLESFAAGEIPQERMYGGDPAAIARAWVGRETYLLTGAADLGGAVDQIRDLVHRFGAR
ncbi:MAG TPA: hypothetical protein PLP50_05220 [Thermoanaerobaculia bacterium]|nr:hypothetical protein [Thermoanaerobaculia bacterium]HQN06290.1 hypothetical protein [Thermoanaerobaculia bacterium]HQP86606.1 hypothetical protein [Thermoanaerobaculia bacterium]